LCSTSARMMDAPAPRPRSLKHGMPTAASKRLVAKVHKESEEQKLGIAFDHEECEMDQRRPVIIGYVQPESPAEKSGLKEWDVIHSINEFTVSSPSGAKELIHRARFCKSIELVAFRPPPRKPILAPRRTMAVAVAAVAIGMVLEELVLKAVLVVTAIGLAAVGFWKERHGCPQQRLCDDFALLESAAEDSQTARSGLPAKALAQEATASEASSDEEECGSSGQPQQSQGDQGEEQEGQDATLLRAVLVQAQTALGKTHESTHRAAARLAQLLEERGVLAEAANIRAHFSLPEEVASS